MKQIACQIICVVLIATQDWQSLASHIGSQKANKNGDRKRYLLILLPLHFFCICYLLYKEIYVTLIIRNK